jgi:drug/metabolite transporter (DMT)-like permease
VSRLRFAGLCVGLFAANGAVSAGLHWFHAMHREHLGPAMFVSAAVMSAGAVAMLRARRPLRLDTSHPHTKVWLLAAIVSTALGLLSWYLYVTSALGATRGTFVDYASVPVFAFLIALALEPTAATGWRSVGTIVLGVTGSVLMLLAANDPSGRHGGSVVAGIGWTLVSAFCGALNLHIARRIAYAVEGAVLVMLRLAVTALFAVALASWRAGTPFVHGNYLAHAIGFGAVMFGFLFVLYGLLQKETVSRISPYLFLIPVATFVFDVLLGTHRLAETERLEWLGMMLIVAALIWNEWWQRSG